MHVTEFKNAATPKPLRCRLGIHRYSRWQETGRYAAPYNQIGTVIVEWGGIPEVEHACALCGRTERATFLSVPWKPYLPVGDPAFEQAVGAARAREATSSPVTATVR